MVAASAESSWKTYINNIVGFSLTYVSNLRLTPYKESAFKAELAREKASQANAANHKNSPKIGRSQKMAKVATTRTISGAHGGALANNQHY
jgi:hypothetical protein